MDSAYIFIKKNSKSDIPFQCTKAGNFSKEKDEKAERPGPFQGQSRVRAEKAMLQALRSAKST